MPIFAGRVVYVAMITGVSRGNITGEDRGNIVPPPIVEASVPVQVGEDGVRRHNTGVHGNWRTMFT
jgi:hypothetical protein